MINSDTYYYLDFKGNARIPNLSDVLSEKSLGGVNLVIPDNNVCQNLAQYFIDKEKLSDVVINKLEKLLIEIDHSGIDVCAAFGILELSSDRETLSIDKNKFKSFGRSIISTLKLPGFNLATGFASSFMGCSNNEQEDIFPLMPMLNLFYTHILKIKLIELNGLNGDNALKNIREYLFWGEKMGVQTIFPTQVAYALFGGESKARKIIKIEKGKSPLQSAWGAAWDMMYLFIAQQYSPLCNIGGIKHRLIFVTNDEACWLIGSLFKLCGSIQENGDVSVSFGKVSIDFPHYKDKIPDLKKISTEIKLEQVKRMAEPRDKERLIDYMNKEKNLLEKSLLKAYGGNCV